VGGGLHSVSALTF